MRPYAASWQRKALRHEMQLAIAARNGTEHIAITPEARKIAIAERREVEVCVPEVTTKVQLACVALAMLHPPTVERTLTKKHMHERDGLQPIDGVRGEWLDDEGFVKPEFREQAAAAKAQHRAAMTPIGEVMVMAQSRRD